MDDHSIVLGMEFMDQVKVVLIPFANIIMILEEGKTSSMLLSYEGVPFNLVVYKRSQESRAYFPCNL